MRLRENEIELVTRFIMHQLARAGGLEYHVPEHEVHELVRKAITDDLMVEEDLNREVEEILRAHTKDMTDKTVDYRKMFAMIKNKLARDRNLTLS